VEALLQVVAREASEGTAFVVPNGDLSEQRITAAAVMPDGVDLAELLAKFLNGAVSFSQGAEDYLAIEGKAGKGLSADNAAIAKAGMNYTLLEHNWDEGLGYFGAARDYTRYQLAEINAGRSLDSNGDGSISLLSEKNYGMSINAARRDLGAPSGSTNYAMGAMQSFLRGRALITSANEQAKPYIAAEATLALGYWERTIAASAVSYVNKVNKILQSYGTEAYSYRNLAKAWAELKGFSLSFQFHPESSLSDGEFDRLHDLLGDSPVLPHRDGPEAVAAYQAKLQEVRAIYQQSFGFDARDVAAW
jgi:hypothetical protein